jgi:hypothetical protein
MKESSPEVRLNIVFSESPARARESKYDDSVPVIGLVPADHP